MPKSGDRVELHWAASEGNLAKANQLLKDGAPVDPQDEVNNSDLFVGFNNS